MSTTPLLKLGNISKTFGGVRALVEVDFEVEPGEIHCLAGENGCGKSTLIKIISGVYKMEPGAHVEFDGEVLDSLSPTLARDLGVQVIWQDLALFEELSVAENIAFEQNLGVMPSWVRGDRMRDAAREVLDRLGFNLNVDQRVADLPIADRQLVAICRSLIADARIIFMDEPTSSLTRAETNALLEIVRRLSSEGIAVVFVSHRLAEVLAICQRVTVLRDGRKVGVYPGTGMTQSRLAMLMTG
ncbi:MAG: ATP-binding cassette domain-containing protein, partial [Rhodospirillales bacterium]|nr:ATP-binding cassette domain-containing protein [Rhodospirillales bacterium]